MDVVVWFGGDLETDDKVSFEGEQGVIAVVRKIAASLKNEMFTDRHEHADGVEPALVPLLDHISTQGE